jgi:hypothetical protein
MKAVGFVTGFIFTLSVVTTTFASNVGDWAVNATFDEGRNTGCIGVGPDHGGTKLSVFVDPNYQWDLIFSNSNWNLPLNQKTIVSVRVDQQPLARGKATSLSRDAIALRVDGTPNCDTVRMGSEIELETPGDELTISLEGSAQALSALLDCVRNSRSSTPSAPEQQAQPQAVPLTEAAVMLTNLLNAAGIQGYRLQPPAPNATSPQFSLADGTTGLFSAFRGETAETFEDYVGQVMGQLSQKCKGDFRSGKTPIPTDDGSLVRLVGVTCAAEDSAFASRVTLVRHPDGFMVQLMEYAPLQSAGQPSQGPIAPKSSPFALKQLQWVER